MATTNEFGAFFKETRQALGLSLREFCRQTGFDQANVSRIERGLVAPPKSERVLKSYAKGLKLKPDSFGWERFMTLAKPPAKPRRGLGHKNWVTARHLENWAGTEAARSLLPQLIRRLVRATANGMVRVEAPAAEQTQRPGWDGIVEAAEESEFVPKGVSRWEMGVDKDPNKKAEEDFAKRLENSLGVTKRTSSFIFITPRKWQKKAEWEEAKTKLKSWKQVRVYDSASLEEWLECAPAVDIWLARQLGLCPHGLTEVDEYWKNLQALTDPSLSAEVYLVSREKQFDQMRKWVKGPPDTLHIQSRSPIEALDFVVASSQKPEFGEEFSVRTLIVETRDAWRSITVGDGALNLVVHPTLNIEPELVAEAVRNGHHVIVCTDAPLSPKYKQIALERVSGSALQKALEIQGVEHYKAEKLTAKCGGSLGVLKRITSRHAGMLSPAWSKTRTIVPLLLAGKWDDTSEGDREALERIANCKYQDVAALAAQWSSYADPLLVRLMTSWKLISREDSWDLAANLLNDDDLKRFETVAIEVLGELDPACELPSNERWKANVLGKVRRYSQTLRTGIAESLALMGVSMPLKNGLASDVANFAAYVVRKILHGKDWKVWASLSNELPLLAEAAPDAFLTALEQDLQRRTPAVINLFDSDSSAFYGSSPYTGLLFALEVLSWDPDSLPRVSLALARLYEVAPTTKLGNSPMRTLEHVFMPWYPQTTAPVRERIRILETIAKKFPKAGWRLLLELLPHPHSMVTMIHRPAFQNWALHWTEKVTQADRASQVGVSSQLLVSLTAKDTDRINDALQMFESFPPSTAEKLLEKIMEIDPAKLSTEIRRSITETLREKVNNYKRFIHTEWASEGRAVEALERTLRHIEPTDVVTRNVWLFDDFWKVRDKLVRGEVSLENFESAEKSVDERRAAALKEIRLERNWDGVLALVAAAARPYQVGLAVGMSETIGDEARILPALLADSRMEMGAFAKGYVFAKRERDDWSWVRKLAIKKWSDAQVIEFALALPAKKVVWELLAKRGLKVEAEYWKKVESFGFGDSADDLAWAAAMLTKAGRPFSAVHHLSVAKYQGVRIDSASIISVLESGAEFLSNQDQLSILADVRHDISNLIGELQVRLEAPDSSLDIDKVAKIEWAYLKLLDGHPTAPKTLPAWLAKDPEFFVELLTYLYRRRGEQKMGGHRPEPSSQDRSRASQVYRLLSSWPLVPGSQPDGSVDGELLRAWVKEVQRLAEAEGRGEVGDLTIGGVLAYAPEEPDGTWPCIAVRDAIEEFGTEGLTEGFEIGIMNKRGAYSKTPDEGGKQERALAEQYLNWADASGIEWSKSAASLRRVAERYEDYARREDAEAAAE